MKPLSVQLYTLREHMQADAAETLRRVKEIGFDVVEPYRFVDDVATVKVQLERHGLRAPSAHTQFMDKDNQDDIFAAAAELGVTTLIQPSSDKALWSDADQIRRYAEAMAEVARKAADHGLSLGYHNHAFEYQGGVDAPLERFVEHTAGAVSLQVDTYWVAVGGDDPVALLQRLGDRVVALHIKDGPITEDSLDQLPVGDGEMPVEEILAAAPHALPVVELDAYRGEMFDAVERSHAYLKGLGR